MGRLVSFAVKAVKVMFLAALGSAARILQARGEGVLETSLQNTLADIAGTYLRRVQNG